MPSLMRRPRWMHVRRDGESGLTVAATLLAVAATVIAAIALLAHQVSTPWQATIVLAALSHQLMWVAPIGVLVALFARRWGTLFVAALVTLVALAIQVPPNIDPVPVSGGTPMTVLQANLKVGSADPDALVALVRNHHVGLLATEELTIGEQQRLIASGLSTLLPYRFTAPLPSGGGGLGMWSRYPLRDEHNLPGYQLGVLSARVSTPGADATFVAVHLLPPYPYPPHEWRTEIGHLHGVLGGLTDAGPVLVAGDFNATTDHAQFRALLSRGYVDAAEEAGAGYLPTYPDDRWFGPVIGIDHVLTRGGARVAAAHTLGLPGSDHRGLLVRLRLP